MRRPSARAVVLVACLVALVWVVASRSYAVLASTSMEPWASPGDLLVHEVVDADQVGVGDVLTVPTDDGLVTHRVDRIVERDDGVRVASLKGDASQLPDPVPVELTGQVARVERIVPNVGTILTTGAPLLWGGLALVLIGAASVRLGQRREQVATTPRRGSDAEAVRPPGRELARPGWLADPVDDPESRVRVVPRVGSPAAPAAAPDPRIEALLATCEEFADQGMPAAMLRDLVRVRTAAVLGLPSAERAGAVLALDDGGRFYIVALADADADALSLVPVQSTRRRGATAALDTWWSVVAPSLSDDTRRAISDWT